MDVGAEGIAERLRLAGELGAALERGQFTFHYQPAFDLRTARPVGVEALIRWEHPERGLVSPGQFLPVADEVGLGLRIGAWALAEVARLAPSMPGLGTGPERKLPPVLWVNVLPEMLRAPGFAAGVLERLGASGVDPARFGIEVTESVMADDSGAVVPELEYLQDVGVRIALDDFGTGASALSRLRSFPVDVVKIDKIFTDELHTRAGRAIVAAIVDLAHAIDAQAFAEAVESRDQLVELRRTGCDLVSGFYLARPVPTVDLLAVTVEGAALLAACEVTPAAGVARRGVGAWLRGSGTATTSPRSPIGDVPLEIDGLTGLGNHRAAMTALSDGLVAGRRPVLLLVDLDGFRAFGLMHDATAADELLRAQARRLETFEGAAGFRLAADRFALVLPDARRGPVSGQLDLAQLAQAPKGTTACVGIAQAREGSTSEEIESRALEALRLAQRRGHGSVIDDLDGDGPAVTVTSAQARALYAVLRQGYLRVHYQPIMSLADDSVLGFEALVRPQLDHGLSGPQEAFEVAGQLGLVPELDAVCRSSVFIDGPGFDMPAGAKLFVNVSPEALGHRSLRHAELGRQIKQSGLDRNRVVFELRESPAIAAEVFDEESRQLIERGFSVALEDVGGRQAGLRAMRAVPFDVVKLAPDLLSDAREDAATAATLDALCAFARHEGTQVIVTGIENRRLLASARALRAEVGPVIHGAQGYLLGKPQPQARTHTVGDPTESASASSRSNR